MKKRNGQKPGRTETRIKCIQESNKRKRQNRIRNEDSITSFHREIDTNKNLIKDLEGQEISQENENEIKEKTKQSKENVVEREDTKYDN